MFAWITKLPYEEEEDDKQPATLLYPAHTGNEVAELKLLLGVEANDPTANIAGMIRPNVVYPSYSPPDYGRAWREHPTPPVAPPGGGQELGAEEPEEEEEDEQEEDSDSSLSSVPDLENETEEAAPLEAPARPQAPTPPQAPTRPQAPAPAAEQVEVPQGTASKRKEGPQPVDLEAVSGSKRCKVTAQPTPTPEQPLRRSDRSEEHTSELQHSGESRMPSSA